MKNKEPHYANVDKRSGKKCPYPKPYNKHIQIYGSILK